jgi:hypothetical protein
VHNVYLEQNKKGRKSRPGTKCQTKTTMSIKADKTVKEKPVCASQAEHGGIKTREGAKSGV